MNLRAKIFNPPCGIPRSEACVHPNALDSAVRVPHSALRTRRSVPAFTLIELLVVIAIIGILAAIGLPAMRGMTRSNAMIAANRQFLDDLTYARQRAIGDHTTVYVVFVSSNIILPANIPLPAGNPALYKQYTNLFTGQFTTYALLSLRQLGDQPGRSTPKYLTGWRSLPNGVFIPPWKFAAFPPPSGTGFFLGNLPFPVTTYTPPNLQVPFLAFNYLGQLVSPYSNPGNPSSTLAPDQYIPLARGSIFINPFNRVADVQENPANNSVNNSNVVYINAFTGRAKILQRQIQ